MGDLDNLRGHLLESSNQMTPLKVWQLQGLCGGERDDGCCCFCCQVCYLAINAVVVVLSKLLQSCECCCCNVASVVVAMLRVLLFFCRLEFAGRTAGDDGGSVQATHLPARPLPKLPFEG